MQHIKHLILSTLVLNMLSCGFLEDKTKDNEAMAVTVQDTTAQNAPADGYIVTPHVAHPKFKALSAAFETQEHRFEIDRCAFKYNGKSFFIGDTEEKIIKIFGKPDKKFLKPEKDRYFLKFSKLKLKLWFSKKSFKIISLSLNLNDDEMSEELPYKILKFRGVPYQLDMTLNEFIELSDLEHSETLDHTLYSFYIKNEKKCLSIPVKTSIASKPAYDAIGSGHITMRGDFDPKYSYPIEGFYITLRK